MDLASIEVASDSHARRVAALRGFMEGHRNVAGRTELLALGLSPTQIRSWIEIERLIRLFRGVYSLGRDVESRESCWRAGLLLGGPGAALTGRSALEYWGAIQLRTAVPDMIEVATTVDRSAVHVGRSPALAHTRVRVLRRRLEPGDVRTSDGLELVRPPLALSDFAARAPEREVRFAFLELCRLRLFRAADVPFCFDRVTRRRGASKVKPLLGSWVKELNRTRSAFEGSFLLDWAQRRFVMPEVNVKVGGLEVDFLWREKRFVLELDGKAFHSDPIARRRDAEKTRSLEGQGFTVIRVTWKEYSADPEGVIARIARELGLV